MPIHIFFVRSIAQQCVYEEAASTTMKTDEPFLSPPPSPPLLANSEDSDSAAADSERGSVVLREGEGPVFFVVLRALRNGWAMDAWGTGPWREEKGWCTFAQKQTYTHTISCTRIFFHLTRDLSPPLPLYLVAKSCQCGMKFGASYVGSFKLAPFVTQFSRARLKKCGRGDK